MSGHTPFAGIKRFRVVPLRCEVCKKEFVLGTMIVNVKDQETDVLIGPLHKTCIKDLAKRP